jgi:integrase
MASLSCRMASKLPVSRHLVPCPALAGPPRILLAARESAGRPLELRELCWSALRIPQGIPALEALRSGQACFVLIEFKGRARRTDSNAERTIPITPRLGRLLLRLCQREDQAGEIFLTARARLWSYNALRCRMRKLRLRAGLAFQIGGERVCMYTMRHTAATKWVADGVSLAVVSELLGHSRLSTTQRYVHLNRQQLLAEFRRRQQPG